MTFRFLSICLLNVIGVATLSLPTFCVAQTEINFTRDIRPIFSGKCFACHGPDDEKREGGFRLDVAESALGEADSGEPPIVPGDADASQMYQRLVTDDEDLRMPPADADKPLTSGEVEKIRLWIEQGAEFQEHWAFVAPSRPRLPETKRDHWARNPIDNFILTRLETDGLAPSPAAEKATLIRRVTFDLTGLPPMPSEIDAFLTDESPGAYGRLVERLLRSPRYGEHMARFWLDAARYGDTHGLHLDNYREMWPYRDWVVRAFNRNLPYDQFTVDQLAGDLLSDPTLDQLIATGFNRCHVSTNEGGSIVDEVYVRNVVDRVVTTGTVFMGMTFECTRCHDHKYDPFTMRDFYSMFAFFNSIDGGAMDGNRKDPAPVIRVPSPEQEEQLEKHNEKVSTLERKLRDPWPEIDRLQSDWERRLNRGPATDEPAKVVLGTWYSLGPFEAERRELVEGKQGPEGKSVNLEEHFELATGRGGWTKHDDWVDGKPHNGLPGQSAANFLFRKITVETSREVTVSLGSDDGIKVYVNGQQVFSKDVSRGLAPGQDQATLSLQMGDNELLVKIMNYGGESGFYFALSEDAASVPEDVLKIVRVEPLQREASQERKLRTYFRDKVARNDDLAKVRSELEQARKARTELEGRIPTTMVFREKQEPRAAYHLIRGEYDQRGDQVSRRTPASLPPMKEGLPLNRLGLAKWLLDPQHPLTARVAVNRLWQQVFGTGIVKTLEDFGSQGELPSHPELLDWLAAELMQPTVETMSEAEPANWDVKHIMRLIVTSATYRQSSRSTPELIRHDPDNRLLARGPRFRLDAEMLRDQALFVSGLLVEKLGGPSVKPPQPGGLWFAVGYSGSNTVRFVPDKGNDKVHRRTLYTFVKRTSPPPQMTTFDAPSREACTMRRERTNTPLQALLLMNDPQYVEAARALAKRTIREGGSDADSRSAYMFQLCTGRVPDAWELEQLSDELEQQLRMFRGDTAAAKKLVSVGGVPADTGLDVDEMAAWTMVANLILNLDEAVTKN